MAHFGSPGRVINLTSHNNNKSNKKIHDPVPYSTGMILEYGTFYQFKVFPVSQRLE